MKLMQRKALWAICLFTWLPLASEQVATTQSNLPTDEYVFAFDLHDVVFQTDWHARRQELKMVPFSLNLVLTLLNPFFLYDLIKISLSTDTYEEVIDVLSAKYPAIKEYEESILTLINTQVPIEGTIKILKDLNAQGYRLYIFSNIGQASFLRLKKFFPEIFDLFDGYVYVEAQDNWIQKPQKESYEKFLNAFNLQPYQVIFIDDRQVNIEGAQKAGFNTIPFTSAAELEQTLKHYSPKERTTNHQSSQKVPGHLNGLINKDCHGSTNL